MQKRKDLVIKILFCLECHWYICIYAIISVYMCFVSFGILPDFVILCFAMTTLHMQTPKVNDKCYLSHSYAIMQRYSSVYRMVFEDVYICIYQDRKHLHLVTYFYIYLNINDPVITYLLFLGQLELLFRSNTIFSCTPFIVQRKETSVEKNHITLNFNIKRNNIIVKYFLLEPPFFGHLFILIKFYCVSIFNGFHLLVNVPDFTCDCQFICANFFIHGSCLILWT